jgi:hypothetical protein
MATKKQPLNSNPSRGDLTDRECAAMLGSVIGGLINLSDVEAIRNAVRWWAETDAAWRPMQNLKDMLATATSCAGCDTPCDPEVAN